MKIAFPTNDESTLTAHFGRAKFFKVLSIEDGTLIQADLRQNSEANHVHQHDEDHQHEQHNHHKFDILSDVDCIISGGMGRSAYQRLLEMKKEVWIVEEKSIDTALENYLNGSLTNHPDKLH